MKKLFICALILTLSTFSYAEDGIASALQKAFNYKPDAKLAQIRQEAAKHLQEEINAKTLESFTTGSNEEALKKFYREVTVSIQITIPKTDFDGNEYEDIIYCSGVYVEPGLVVTHDNSLMIRPYKKYEIKIIFHNGLTIPANQVFLTPTRVSHYSFFDLQPIFELRPELKNMKKAIIGYLNTSESFFRIIKTPAPVKVNYVYTDKNDFKVLMNRSIQDDEEFGDRGRFLLDIRQQKTTGDPVFYGKLLIGMNRTGNGGSAFDFGITGIERPEIASFNSHTLSSLRKSGLNPVMYKIYQ
ncbi:hypothetical protein AAIR98_001050 [Elusimicrobium simillimum]|uniref:hypothetical protein n=1 Tax=Elusimicrobium simillimum TaxID=3143438 RepID=UPI003C6F2BBB